MTSTQKIPMAIPMTSTQKIHQGHRINFVKIHMESLTKKHPK